MEKVEFVESIKIRRETKQRLIKFRATLEARLGRKVSLDETINYLIDVVGEPDVEAFTAAVYAVRERVRPGELMAILREGRSEDEDSS